MITVARSAVAMPESIQQQLLLESLDVSQV
jgi:hypothetical protein